MQKLEEIEEGCHCRTGASRSAEERFVNKAIKSGQARQKIEVIAVKPLPRPTQHAYMGKTAVRNGPLPRLLRREKMTHNL